MAASSGSIGDSGAANLQTPSIELSPAPSDTTSRVTFAPNDSNLLLVSSWDSQLRLYDITANTHLKKSFAQPSALLDCCFLGNSNTCVTAGLGCEVWMLDLRHESETTIGSHAAPVRCIEYYKPNNTVFTGGWDKVVKAWDVRSKVVAQEAALPGKVFALSAAAKSGKLVVCDSTKTLSVFDVRNLSKPETVRNTATPVLKFQYRAVACFPSGEGFAVSSIEGRVAWEYFEKDVSAASSKKNYAFKCHREKGVDGVETVYPVNALAFHPLYGTFATGGADGGVSIWDGYNKKRLWRLPKNYPTSVTSLAFSHDGTYLAMGISYDFSQGPKEVEISNQIVIRTVRTEDVKPKTTK